jgi:hypothetical protein
MLRTQKIIVFLILFCFASEAIAQSRKVPNRPEYDLAPYHFGFLLGINQMYFTLDSKPDYQKKVYTNKPYQYIPDINTDSAYLFNMEASTAFGFVIGIVSNLRMGDHFDMRFTPSLTFGERNLQYTLKSYYLGDPPQIINVTKNIQSTFVEFPVWIRFKGNRIQNVRPYVLAGGKYSLDLASNAKKKAENSLAYVFINRKDIYALGGVGFDFYTAYFKFGTELTMSYGLFDVLKRDNTIYTDAVNRMSSKIFQISFTFE